MTISTIV